LGAIISSFFLEFVLFFVFYPAKQPWHLPPYQNTDTKETQHKKIANSTATASMASSTAMFKPTSENIDKELQWNILKEKSNRRSDMCFLWKSL